MEVEGLQVRNWAWANEIDTDLFAVFALPILAGRGFVPLDAARGSNAVIVDQTFAEQMLAGRPVIGQRVRQWVRRQDNSGEADAGPWLEIVGVVPAFTPPPPFERVAPKLFKPLALAHVQGTVQLAVRMKRDAKPVAFLGRIREITRSVDTSLQFGQLQTVSQEEQMRRKGLLSLAIAIVAVTGSVLLLSAAGIYAMMSFTVASRRREIGIRAALGAAPRRVLSGIFGRAGAQVGAGVVSGLILAEAVAWAAGGGSLLRGEGVLLLPLVATLMMAIGLIAALGPARRGLAVQPTEALRGE
jgi:hypothetical protein